MSHSAEEDAGTRVDFGYAFAPPHRMTVCRPGSPDKTLLDLEPGRLTVAWTYENLTERPLVAFTAPEVNWKVQLRPALDGAGFGCSSWRRAPGGLPILDNVYSDARGSLRIEAAGGATGALLRVTVCNTGEVRHRFSLDCELLTGIAGHVPAWLDPGLARDVLFARFKERADRVLLFGLGAADTPFGSKTLGLAWELAPGETRTGWLIRPYRAYEGELPELRARDWEQEFAAAQYEWQALLARAASLCIPDPRVQEGFAACLSDLFVMREPLAGGYVGAIMGTEVYRSCNPFEGSLVAIALDQLGLHDEAAAALRVELETQEPSGEWADPQGWCHHMWGASGLKAWAAMEHYRLTGDRPFLEDLYPRLLANSRWQETQRARTRLPTAAEGGAGSADLRPPTYGLMPRGMGDAGLMNDDDFYGVFFPHNILAVYADRLAVEAAGLLDRRADQAELSEIYERARGDLLAAFERGAIAEGGAADGSAVCGAYRWLPGVPGKRSGSRWGVLYALWPTGLLPADHPLIQGTLRFIESRMSPGGHPIHTGWMADGCWVAISLDNLAEAHLAAGDGDPAAEYLYATLNHGTPLYTWCEERGVEPGTSQCSGDRQHLWTPVAVVRALRDMLLMEEGAGLHLARGTARGWLASGRPLGIARAATHFGTISYQVSYDPSSGRVSGELVFPDHVGAEWAVLHVRLPGGMGVVATGPDCRADRLPDGSGLRWQAPRGRLPVDAVLGPAR